MRIVLLMLTVFMLHAFAFAGKTQAPVLFEPGKITSPVVCETDATQSYAVYMPAKGNKDALPVIYFFDPHADGELPLTKYRQLADEYGFILIGSNNSKNGNDWPTTENIWQHLFSDAQKKLKINANRVYTCGFSGGAKVAGYIALKYAAIKGVIANGAGLPDGVAAGNYAFSFTGIAGEGDMNMGDIISFCSALDNTTTRHSMLIFDGKHEWAPASTMITAFAGLQLYGMQLKLITKDDAFIGSYVTQAKQRVNAFQQLNQYIKALRECKLAISLLDGISTEATWFQQQSVDITANRLYQQQMKQQQVLLAKEESLKAGYMQQFQQGDMEYWKKTITNLQILAIAKTAESMMYQRLLAWLSLACYSISNQLINSNQNTAAKQFVEIYKLADPTNSEAWYFSAVVDARSLLKEIAESDLLKAVQYGFADKARLERQPEFKQLKINFTVVENKMKK